MNAVPAQQQGFAPAMPQQVMNPPRQSREEKYKKTIYGLGMAEVIIGTISGVATIISIIVGSTYLYAGFTYVAQGIWCNVFLITSGVLGLCAKSNPSRCMYNANMALSIVSAIFMVLLVILSSLAAAIDRYEILIVLHIIIALLGFVGLIFSVIHSACCCAGICCSDGYSGVQVVYVPQQQMVPVQLPNGQIAMYPAQPNVSIAGLPGPSTQFVIPPGPQAVQVQQPVQPTFSSAPPSYNEMNVQK